jgi:hypothetical protein
LDLKAAIYGQVRRVVGTTFFGYRGVLGGSEEPWNMWLRARRRIGGLLKGLLEELIGQKISQSLNAVIRPITSS